MSTDRSHLGRFCFFAAGTPLLGLVVVTLAVTGIADLFKAPFGATLFLLVPFLFIGMIAGAASMRGRTIGWCTWLGGFAPVLALSVFGGRVYQQGMQAHAWTGASLTLAMTVFAALPASIVGSLIGRWIGYAILKDQDEATVDRKAGMECNADEPGTAP